MPSEHDFIEKKSNFRKFIMICNFDHLQDNPVSFLPSYVFHSPFLSPKLDISGHVMYEFTLEHIIFDRIVLQIAYIL